MRAGILHSIEIYLNLETDSIEQCGRADPTVTWVANESCSNDHNNNRSNIYYHHCSHLCDRFQWPTPFQLVHRHTLYEGLFTNLFCAKCVSVFLAAKSVKDDKHGHMQRKRWAFSVRKTNKDRNVYLFFFSLLRWIVRRRDPTLQAEEPQICFVLDVSVCFKREHICNVEALWGFQPFRCYAECTTHLSDVAGRLPQLKTRLLCPLGNISFTLCWFKQISE